MVHINFNENERVLTRQANSHFVKKMAKEQVAESLLATTRSDTFPWTTHTAKQPFSN